MDGTALLTTGWRSILGNLEEVLWVDSHDKQFCADPSSDWTNPIHAM